MTQTALLAPPTASATTSASSEPFVQAFRRACRQFATGVTVVTVRDDHGARGMTANMFMSASLDPPLVLVAIHRRHRTHQLLDYGTHFAVSVLSAEQQDWSDRFAGRQGELQGRFDDVPHRLTDAGLPLLDDALASFVCRTVAIHVAGDHSLFIGRVESIESAPGGPPLLYFDSEYRTLDGSPVPERRPTEVASR